LALVLAALLPPAPLGERVALTVAALVVLALVVLALVVLAFVVLALVVLALVVLALTVRGFVALAAFFGIVRTAARLALAARPPFLVRLAAPALPGFAAFLGLRALPVFEAVLALMGLALVGLAFRGGAPSRRRSRPARPSTHWAQVRSPAAQSHTS
jgi:hypothetical protein